MILDFLLVASSIYNAKRYFSPLFKIAKIPRNQHLFAMFDVLTESSAVQKEAFGLVARESEL